MTEPLPPLAADVPMEPARCEHHYMTMHEPGHRLYWVQMCSLCHKPGWDDLDAQVDELVAAAIEAYARTPETQRGKR